MSDIDRIKGNLNSMLGQGASEKDMDDYVTSEGISLAELQGRKEKMMSDFAEEDAALKTKFKKEFVSDVARPILEFGGLTAGSIAGTAVAPASPAGPLSPVVGGAAGYATGSRIADKLDEWMGISEEGSMSEEFGKTGTALKEGAEIEMMGQSIAKVIGVTIGGVIKLYRKVKSALPKLSDNDAMMKAKDILEDLQNIEGPNQKEIVARLKETKELLHRADIKTKPTFSQKSGSEKAASFEQSVAAKNPEVGALLKAQDQKIAQEAFENVQKQFPKDGSIGSFLSALEKENAKLLSISKKSSAIAESSVAGIKTSQATPKSVGEETVGLLQVEKKAARNKAQELFDELPDLELSAKPIAKIIKDVVSDIKKIGGGKNSIPSDIIRQIKAALVKGKDGKLKDIPFSKLRDWRSQTTTMIRDNRSGSNPNMPLVRRLEKIKAGIDDALNQMESTGVAEQYKAARGEYRKYVQTYRKGSVGDVLQPGNLSSGNKVAFSDVPERFFKAGKIEKAEDLINAVGEQDARSLIKDFTSHDFLAQAGTSEGINLKLAQTWLKNNASVLKRFGLYDDFANMASKQEIAQATYKTLEEFQTKTAGKILGKDINKVIEFAFGKTGKGEAGKTATELLNLPGIKDNKVAQDGLRVGFRDFLMKQMEITGRDSVGKTLRSVAKSKKLLDDFYPAMEKLFSKNQMQSIKDYHEILRLLEQNKNVTYSSGSATAEKAAGDKRGILSILGNVAQFTAVQAQKGWKFSATKNLAKSIYNKIVKDVSEDQVNAILHRAIVDPEFAETVMMMSSGSFNKKVVESRIKSHLLKLGIYTGEKLRKNITENIKGGEETETRKKNPSDGEWWSYTEESGWQVE